jgi:hypothetical protein
MESDHDIIAMGMTTAVSPSILGRANLKFGYGTELRH